MAEPSRTVRVAAVGDTHCTCADDCDRLLERDRVPAWVVDERGRRLAQEAASSPPATHVCRGTLPSRTQYAPDVRAWGYADGRVPPHGTMRPDHARCFTEAGHAEQRKTS